MQRHAASVGTVVVSVVFPPNFHEIYIEEKAKEDKLDRTHKTCALIIAILITFRRRFTILE